MLDNQQLTMDVTIQNTSNAPVFYTLTVIIVNSGTISMINGSFLHQIGIFTSQDVLNMQNSDAPIVPYQVNNSVYGGSWLSDIGNFFTKLRDKVKPYVSPVLDLVSARNKSVPLKIARELTGLGKKPRKSKKKAGALVGGDLVGGELMSNKMLHDRLMNY